MSWRERVSYPAHVPRRSRCMLDELDELVPLPYSGDTFVDLADWLRQAEACGLITAVEHGELRSALAPNI